MLKKGILVLGHAGKPNPDAITLDIDPEHKPDVVHDLQIVPWPFEDDAFKEIIAHHVLEHLNDLSAPMKELHRICRKDGVIRIEVPHHTAWFAKGPYHKLYFGYFAFDDDIAGKSTWVTAKKFSCLKREITFHKLYRTFFLHRLFNRFPLAYERFFCYLFPAEHLKVWLLPVK
jgi:predicted SAM-dependent methyltransferase